MVYKSDIAWQYSVTLTTLRTMLRKVPGLTVEKNAKRVSFTDLEKIYQFHGRPLKKLNGQ